MRKITTEKERIRLDSGEEKYHHMWVQQWDFIVVVSVSVAQNDCCGLEVLGVGEATTTKVQWVNTHSCSRGNTQATLLQGQFYPVWCNTGGRTQKRWFMALSNDMSALWPCLVESAVSSQKWCIPSGFLWYLLKLEVGENLHYKKHYAILLDLLIGLSFIWLKSQPVAKQRSMSHGHSPVVGMQIRDFASTEPKSLLFPFIWGVQTWPQQRTHSFCKWLLELLIFNISVSRWSLYLKKKKEARKKKRNKAERKNKTKRNKQQK